MRHLLFAILLVPVLGGCLGDLGLFGEGEEADAFQPKQIRMKAFAGYSTTQPLVFRYKGRPVVQPQVELVNENLEPRLRFSLEPKGPEQSPETIRFHSPKPGSHSATLIVRHGNGVHRVAVSGESLPSECPADTQCRYYTFDPDTGTCVASEPWNGSRCSSEELACDGIAFCDAGECVVSSEADISAVCPAAQTATLSPKWSFQSLLGRRVFGYQCAVGGSEGELYCMESYRADDSGDSTCDLVALTSEGTETWRQPGICPSILNSFQLQVAGDRILFGLANEGEVEIQIRDRADGTLLKSITEPFDFHTSFVGFILAGTDRLATAVVVEEGVIEIRLFDLSSAELLKTVPVQDPESTERTYSIEGPSLLGDLEGNVILSWSESEFPSGVLTYSSHAVVMNAEGKLLARESVNGTNGYFRVNAIVDGRLYTSQGRILDSKTLREVGRLPWFNENFPTNRTVVLAPSGAGYSLQHERGQTFACLGWNLQSITSSGQEASDCRVTEDKDTTAFPFLGEDGSAAVLFSGPGYGTPATVRIHETRGEVRREYVLHDKGEHTYVDTAPTFSKNALFVVTKEPNSWLLSLNRYELPGFELASHGWVMAGGNPSGTSRPW